MTESQQMKEAIQSIIQSMMDRVMNRVLESDPFIIENHRAQKPLYAALVPDEIFKNAHFERRFVTPFGKVWERLAKVAADQGIGEAALGHSIHGTVKAGRLRRIQGILDQLEHPERGNSRKRPNWRRELSYIRAGRGQKMPVEVVADVYVEDTTNDKKYAFEVKAPMPG